MSEFWMSLVIENRYQDRSLVVTRTTVRCSPPPSRSDAEAFAEWVDTNVRQHTGTGRVEGDAWYDVTITQSSDPSWMGRQFGFGY